MVCPFAEQEKCMKITVIAVGKLKEKYWRAAIDEYARRLGRYVSFEIIEVADEQTSENASAKEEENVKRIEGERILKRLPENSLKTALAINGKKMDSVGFSSWISDSMLRGASHISFIIGGSLGLSDEVLQKADVKISFSDMTFPHQLMRVILAERIYRAFRIMKNEPYHK